LTIHYNLWYNIPDQKIKAEVRQQMRHADWHPSNFDPDPSEEVADNTPDSLYTRDWKYRLPSSNAAVPAMLSIALRHGITLDKTD
jgi:hypothetical protein